MYEIQPPVPLSSSALWRLQTLSYNALGMTAWAKDRTPSYITSNPHFAEATARVVFGLLVDLAPRGEPVTLVELGAGSGRFSWLLLKALTAIAAASPLQAAPWRLVMTDAAASLLRAWRRHPQLAPFVASGHLDFARFDVGAPAPLHISSREAPLARGPWIVLANYLWDSVPQDAYEVGGPDAAVQALHVGLLSDEDPAFLPAPEVVRHLRLLQQRQPTPADLDPVLRAGLDDYARAFSTPTTVLAPTAAHACIQWFAERGPAVVLSADKGVSTLAHISDGERLPVALHGGTASMTVDFHLLSRLLRARGGWTRDGDPREPLFLHHLAVLGLAPAAVSHGLLAFEQAFSVGGGYALYQLCRATAEEGVLPSLSRLRAMLTLTHADPDVVWTFSRALHAHLEADPEGAAALVPALAAVGERVYTLPEDEDDVDTLLAELAGALSAPDVAEAAWGRVIENRGATSAALHGRALALSMLGRPAEALACVQQALTLPISHQRLAELSQWAAALQAWAALPPELLDEDGG